jgi:hypothetical protein
LLTILWAVPSVGFSQQSSDEEAVIRE